MLILQENTIIEPVANPSAEATEEKVNATMLKNACENATNNIIQKAWELINEVNSFIATIEYDYKEANKDEVTSILNSVIDDTTVNIGMLYKVISLFDNKTTELLDAGEQKADDLIQSESSEQLEISAEPEETEIANEEESLEDSSED